MNEARWNFQLEDGFNNLDVAMTECIVAGMKVGEAREVCECILSLRDLRVRLEKALAVDLGESD